MYRRPPSLDFILPTAGLKPTMARLSTNERGFSLVEAMIVVAIMAILLALALPMTASYMDNSRVRNAAEVFVSSVMTAKAEAAQRNTRVEIVLLADTTAAGLTTAGISAAKGWAIRTFDQTVHIEGVDLVEGSGGTSSPVTVTAVDQDGGALDGVVFGSLGGTTLAKRADFNFTHDTGGNCIAAAGPIRCLRVTVTTTGRVKLCDPSIADLSDTRSCN
ncbi:MAG: GspH/FimT family pseudopilin [Burkholderiaceae bacterium]|nr:GspH/FimT family pseudopilin [Sulfuritalea sp.]MCF8174670.1 GspH/FimT family pseudopilin [Burkholderiaceae bacterium]